MGFALGQLGGYPPLYRSGDLRGEPLQVAGPGPFPAGPGRTDPLDPPGTPEASEKGGLDSGGRQHPGPRHPLGFRMIPL